MKLEFSRQIFAKYSNIKFHENPSIGSRVVPCRRIDTRTDMMKLYVYVRRTNKMHTFFTSDLIYVQYITMHGSEYVKCDEANGRFSQFCENVYISVQQFTVLICISCHSHVPQVRCLTNCFLQWRLSLFGPYFLWVSATLFNTQPDTSVCVCVWCVCVVCVWCVCVWCVCVCVVCVCVCVVCVCVSVILHQRSMPCD
jgi:hypothetical protein